MIKTIRGFMKRLNEDHVGAYAAQSAYFILLSFIPFVLLVVTLVKYTPLTRDDVYSVLINMLPTEFQSYVGGIVNEIFYQSVAYMPITIITTLWSAGKGIAALTNGLNSIYHVTETRNYIINRLRGMAYTLIFAAAFLTSLVLLVFGTRIQNKLTEHLPMVARVTSSIMGMRTLITTGVLAVLFLVLYKCIPNRKQALRASAGRTDLIPCLVYFFPCIFHVPRHRACGVQYVRQSDDDRVYHDLDVFLHVDPSDRRGDQRVF